MTPAAILTRASAIRVLGALAHRLDSLPIVVDAHGAEVGFLSRDVEALRDGRWQAKRYVGARVERVIERR